MVVAMPDIGVLFFIVVIAQTLEFLQFYLSRVDKGTFEASQSKPLFPDWMHMKRAPSEHPKVNVSLTEVSDGNDYTPGHTTEYRETPDISVAMLRAARE